MATKGIRIPIMWKSDPRGLTEAQKRMQKFSKAAKVAGAAAAAGLAVAGAAAVKFGIDSVKAFAEAEQAQNRLEFALEKFPKLADTNIEALRRLNSAMQRKTRFDDDAIASAQGVLAQFQLTGKQLEQLTPLLLDYAARTGKDLTTSAEDLGRAILGQGRALRVLGIDFQDTGSQAGNFDQLVQGLSSSVGGFAEKDAETAAGKLEQLQNRFGDVQEVVGEALMPALDRLMNWMDGEGLAAVEGFAGWLATDGIDAIEGFVGSIAQLAEDGKLVPLIVGGLASITTAQLALNAAMVANPVGLFLAALAILGAQITFVTTNLEAFKVAAGDTSWGTVFLAMITGWAGQIAFFAQNWDRIMIAVRVHFTRQVNGMITAINFLLAPLQGLLDLINKLTGSRFSIRLAPLDMSFAATRVQARQASTNTSQMGGGVTAFADGGVVMPRAGGTIAQIGEAGEAEAVMPLSWLEGRLGGGGGNVYNINVNAGMGADGASLGREIVAAIKRYERTSGPVFASA